jgi:serine phosphatase RsbU (regulator of sigma subunit)
MALRFRTRLTLTVSALTLFITAVMTLATALLFFQALNNQMWDRGRFFTVIANENIEFGLALSSKVERRLEEQMEVTAQLSAELADLSTKQNSISIEELVGIYQKVLAEATTPEGDPIIGHIDVEGPRGGALLGDPEAPRGDVSVASRAGDYTVSITTSPTLERAIQKDFELQGFIKTFMFENNFRRIAVFGTDGEVLAAIDDEGRAGDTVVDADLQRAAREYMRGIGARVAAAGGKTDDVPDFMLIGATDLGVFTPLQPPDSDQFYALFIQHNAGAGLQFIGNRVMALVSLGVIMLLVGIVVTILLSRSLSRPIMHLTAQVREFGKGNLNHRLTWKRRDEFRDLAETFNIMAISLQEYMHELERETTQRERLESELRIASQLQTTLLPEAPPETPALQLSGMSEPSREVGGDFFDFIEVSPTKLAIVVGDATGKGLSAALLITQCASILRTLAHDIHDPGQLLTRTNKDFHGRVGATHRFVTLLVVIVDLDTGVVTYANAGHPWPYRINGHGNPEELDGAASYPLGIEDDTVYQTNEVRLSPGDTIVLYSDGLTDAQNNQRELFGEHRIEATLKEVAQRDPESILTALRQAATTHMNGREAHDDMTIVIARFAGKKAAAPATRPRRKSLRRGVGCGSPHHLPPSPKKSKAQS